MKVLLVPAPDHETKRPDGVKECIGIKSDEQGSYFGHHMKIWMTLDEAKEVRDKLIDLLKNK